MPWWGLKAGAVKALVVPAQIASMFPHDIELQAKRPWGGFSSEHKGTGAFGVLWTQADVCGCVCPAVLLGPQRRLSRLPLDPEQLGQLHRRQGLHTRTPPPPPPCASTALSKHRVGV